ncbi:hypothetical protein D3C71_2065120 [compost metagenome]
MAGGDAEARIALNKEGVAATGQGADLREQIRTAGHRTAPGQVDFHVLEIGENLQHQVAVPGFQVQRNVLDQRCGRTE